MANAENLCELYEKYNRREFVHPDPLEFLYDYKELRDREIVGLIASCLAYGAVRQILKSVSAVLKRMESPYEFLRTTDRDSLLEIFKEFKHRFTTGEELATMLWGVKLALEKFGSLKECFEMGLKPEHDNITPALADFARELSSPFERRPRSLLPSPDLGSACKRLNLFLRWMVRIDAVDPGGWDDVPRTKLIIPLDVHMHRISRQLGLTTRKQADLRTAYEITAAFRKIEPEDPIRYDFVLTRLGIRDDLDPEEFLQSCRMKASEGKGAYRPT
ncbi:MAG: TIGR02757 family protein [Desulfomonile tiedjei]|uniref:TIGR02757 family protein n=1 Tax=Desulfomonile tiedjei TaxID=2358 RepID=A0A9D6V4J8_9BACT|nr:TIGR02757 family protein [Desulfomonile tiedjei]